MDQAAHVGRRLIAEIGDELREARLRAGLRQRDVAAAIGVSQTKVARIEGGQLATVALLDVARHAGAVGLKLHARMYPAGPPLRDRAQLALLDRFHRRISAEWQVRLEAPLQISGDQRAWDLLLRSGILTIGVEAISRLRDVQAQVRAAQPKRHDANVTRLILLVAATHSNRRALSAAERLVRAEFTLGTRPALVALAAGRDPGGDALVLA
ncbi:MAG: helix-turn-helix domain-containing protein [Candidatus Limnocylindria bacterium]